MNIIQRTQGHCLIVVALSIHHFTQRRSFDNLGKFPTLQKYYMSSSCSFRETDDAFLCCVFLKTTWSDTVSVAQWAEDSRRPGFKNNNNNNNRHSS